MNKLTENSIKKAEILEKQYKIYDGDGMFLLVHPNGSKYWRMKYKYDGKSKLASFGVWPSISLKVARERRLEAKKKIKMGINPVEEKRRNKKLQQKYTLFNVNKDSVNANKLQRTLFHWTMLLSPYRKMKDTEESLQLLKSYVFGSSSIKSLSLLDKQEVNEILSNIYKNRSELFQISWKFFLSFPIINIAVLFLLLIIVLDLFPAILTTVLYFILTVCVAVFFSIWEEK